MLLRQQLVFMLCGRLAQLRKFLREYARDACLGVADTKLFPTRHFDTICQNTFQLSVEHALSEMLLI